MNGTLLRQPETDYLEKNKQSWNQRVDVHVASAFYDNESFLAGKSTLNTVELGLLGNTVGKSILHLQCHFGQDSISLARMGAEVTAVDLSDKAIEKGREFALCTGTAINFICCDIYDLPNHLQGQFDIVFASYGTIGWLPDMNKWAAIVSRFLKAGGELIFVEFHPFLWMFDADFTRIDYPYSSASSEPIIEQLSGTYADRATDLKLEDVSWNHSLADVFGGLMRNGMEIISFDEFDYSPYPCFNHLVENEPKKFRIRHLAGKVPMVYALKAQKKVERVPQ